MILLESLETIGSSPFFAWLMDQLRAIAALRVPVLTAIMSALTYLGHEMGFLVIGMIIMWCINKRYGYRFLGIFMLGSFLQQALKAAFMIPRPWIIDPTFQAVANAIPAASGYSFPSGHTLTACITLGGLAMLIKKKWAYACALILTLLVAFSRMYLGVHTLLDVSVGFLLGVLVLVFFGLMFRNEGEQKGKLNAVLCISSAACIGLLVYLLMSPLPANPAFHPMAKESIANAYVLVGASVGIAVAAGFAVLGTAVASETVGRSKNVSPPKHIGRQPPQVPQVQRQVQSEPNATISTTIAMIAMISAMSLPVLCDPCSMRILLSFRSAYHKRP